MLAVYLLAALSNMRRPVAAAEYARALDQEELRLLGSTTTTLLRKVLGLLIVTSCLCRHRLAY